MGIITWIILGLIAGVIAKMIMPGRDPGGFVITIILGIVGAFLGGWIATQLGIATFDGLTIQGVLVATAGAIILLVLYRLMKRT